MKKALLVVAVAFAALSSIAEAQFQGGNPAPRGPGFGPGRPGGPGGPGGPGHGPGRPPEPPRPPGPPAPPPAPPRPPMPPPGVGERVIQKVIYVNRDVRNERLAIDRLLSPQDMRDVMFGELEQITVEAYEQNRRGALMLLVNGFTEDRVDNVWGQVVLRPSRPARLDRQVRIDLDTQGRLQLRTIVLHVRVRDNSGPGPGPGPGPGSGPRPPVPGQQEYQARLPVNRAIYNERFFLLRDLNLAQNVGSTVVDVVVRARALNPQQLATVTVLVNGQVIGGLNPAVGGGQYNIRLTGARTIGRDLQSLQLDASQVIIDDITVRLLR